MLFKNTNQLINNGLTPEIQKKRHHILEILTAALHVVNPYDVVTQCFKKNTFIHNENTHSLDEFDNIFLIGFGKASIPMAQAIKEKVKITKGVIISNYLPKNLTISNVEICLGGHPIPTQKSIDGTHKIISLLQQTTKNDLVIVVISGGGSALLCNPRIPLNELQSLTNLLLRSGANITEINTIRKHLSYVKGGQLVKFCRASLLSLIISDVVNDPIEFIASGPTAPDSTTFEEAKNILEKYKIWDRIPPQIQQTINDGCENLISETPKPDDPIFSKVNNYIIANNTLACEAGNQKAKELGYSSDILSTPLIGEARIIGEKLVEIMGEKKDSYTALISGGETTVTIHGTGRGGRNQELLLSMVPLIADSHSVITSFATDGIDGNCEAAGGIIDGQSLNRGKNKGLSNQELLMNNDSNSFFSQLNDILLTGPTGTNVMDIQVILL